MSDQIFSIFVGVGIVLIGVLVVVYEFLWWLKVTKLRWPLAIIGFLSEITVAGFLAYGAVKYLPPIFR